MACYLGCGTTRNKVMYALIAALMLVSGTCIGLGLSKLPVCRRSMPMECQRELARTGQSQLGNPVCRQSLMSCFRPWLILAGVGLAALAGAMVTGCVMCCCNKAPKHHSQAFPSDGTGVQMVGHPYPAPYGAQQAMPQHPYASHYAPTGQQQHQQQHQPPGYPGGGSAVAAGPPGGYPYPPQQQQPNAGRFAPQPAATGTPYATPQGTMQQQPQQQHPQAAMYSGVMGTPQPQQTQGNVPVQQI